MVQLTDPKGYTTTDKDVTPSGYETLKVKPGTDKLYGTDAAERITFSDLARDNDQIINSGGGDDIFIFRGSDKTTSSTNGIVVMGEGNDTVFLNFQIEDYAFTLRDSGAIKIKYVGNDPANASFHVDGDAVTFSGADVFTFRNVDDVTGVNYGSTQYTYDELVAKILAAEGAA